MKISPGGLFSSVIFATALATTPALSCPLCVFPWINPFTEYVETLLSKDSAELLPDEIAALARYSKIIESQKNNPEGYVPEKIAVIYKQIVPLIAGRNDAP
jgi:hypothetical protein